MINNLKEAIKYVRENKQGTLKELETKIEPEIIQGMLSLGDLNRPVIQENGELLQGWSFSAKGEETYQFLWIKELYKPSFCQRIVDATNAFFLKKCN